MNQKISPKIIALTFGVLVVCFTVGFYALAVWQEPQEVPPQDNVAAPINVGVDAQTKKGPLIVNSEGFLTGLVVQNGEICFGSSCRTGWPVTGVIITYKMTASSYKSGDRYYPRTKSYACPSGANSVETYCKIIMVDGKNNQDFDACQCSTGSNAASLTAYVSQCYGGEGGTSCFRDYDPFCEPSTSYYNEVSCSIPGICEIQFQCGVTETVGE